MQKFKDIPGSEKFYWSLKKIKSVVLLPSMKGTARLHGAKVSGFTFPIRLNKALVVDSRISCLSQFWHWFLEQVQFTIWYLLVSARELFSLIRPQLTYSSFIDHQLSSSALYPLHKEKVLRLNWSLVGVADFSFCLFRLRSGY